MERFADFAEVMAGGDSGGQDRAQGAEAASPGCHPLASPSVRLHSLVHIGVVGC